MKSNSKSAFFGIAAVSTLAAGSYYLYKYISSKSKINKCKSDYELYNRAIFIVNSCEEFEQLVKEYDLMNETVMGVDAEWTHTCPLSIVQLTFKSINIIIQVERLDSMPPPSLNEMMKKPEIIKSGVGIHEDAKRLMKYLVIDEVNGIVDLADVAHHMGHTDIKTNLQYLTEKYLHIHITKDPNIRCGDWDISHLDKEQIMYAASDSYFSRELFVYFYNEYCKTVPASSQLSSYDWALTNHLEKSIEEVHNEGKVHVNVIDSKGEHYQNMNISQISGYKTGGYTKRKHPVYEDCRLLSPDGELLCYTNRRKLDWYVSKNLGTLIDDNPPTVQLNFQPKAKKSFNVTSVDNVCVVCGKTTDYISHSILPHKYRKFLPVQWKSHNNHDNVILCIQCSIRCNKYDDIYSRQILQQYGFHANSVAIVVNQEVARAKNVAGVLLRIYNHQIQPPLERKIELEKKFLEFVKKYNPVLWICKDENSKKNAIYEVVTDEEYKRMQQDSDMEYSDEECILPSCLSSDSTSPITIENPYADKEIDETEGVENFDRSILLKAVNLSTYSIDPDYVSPEERVMKKILSSENKEISF